jgi:hypothetical protein
VLWHSTPQSAEARQPTALAIAEMLGACALAVWLAMYRESLLFLLVGAGIAPLLLLRTPASTERGLGLFLDWEQWLRDHVERPLSRREEGDFELQVVWSLLTFPVYAAAVTVVTLGIRIWVTIDSTRRDLKGHVGAIPRNCSCCPRTPGRAAGSRSSGSS